MPGHRSLTSRDDLASRPWEYPGEPAEVGGLLQGGRLHPRVLPAPPQLEGRRAVVAVGSNASPAVLVRKLQRAGRGTTVPVLRGHVHGLDVGHSAHVSRAGYVAAAPFRAPGVRTPVVVTFLEPDQLAALDATEPNYTRRWLDAARHPVELDGAPAPDGVEVYVSDHGVLAEPTPEGRRALRLRRQAAVLVRLRRCPGVAPLLPHRPRAAARALAADAALRHEVRACLHAAGWVRPSELALVPSGLNQHPA